MDLDFERTRRMFLAGTVAFPTPYPSVGTISFAAGNFEYSRREEPKTKGNEAAKTKGNGAPTPRNLIVVSDYPYSHCDPMLTRAVLQEDVAAIFIPGTWELEDEFRIARCAMADDLEAGEWFVDADVNAKSVRTRLRPKRDKSATEDLPLSGIVFVAEGARVLNTAEIAATAQVSCELVWPSVTIGRASCYGGK